MQLEHLSMSCRQSSVAIAPSDTYSGENQTSCVKTSENARSQSSMVLVAETIHTIWYEIHLMLVG